MIVMAQIKLKELLNLLFQFFIYLKLFQNFRAISRAQYIEISHAQALTKSSTPPEYIRNINLEGSEEQCAATAILLRKYTISASTDKINYTNGRIQLHGKMLVCHRRTKSRTNS